MEDFGYQKDKEDKESSNFNKQIFLALAVIASISLFVYITISAYHFVYQDDENVELIKAPQVPIRISLEENSSNSSDPKIDRNIYEDIFGNKKEAGRIEDTKVANTIETALPPEKTQNSNNAKNNFENNSLQPAPNIQANSNTAIQNNLITPDLSTTNPTSSDNSFNQTEKETLSNNTNEEVKTNERRKFIRVQIAAMSSQEHAQEQWKKLLRNHPDLFINLRSAIQKVDLGKRGIFYRLQIGEFFNQIEAENFCQKYLTQTQKTRADCIVVE